VTTPLVHETEAANAAPIVITNKNKLVVRGRKALMTGMLDLKNSINLQSLSITAKHKEHVRSFEPHPKFKWHAGTYAQQTKIQLRQLRTGIRRPLPMGHEEK
jgi:hypothetical protein